MTAISQPLRDAFDAVVMFTWSDWWSEPRSNRYHYATRLARFWPVIFVQTTIPEAGHEPIEKVDGHNIFIVHAGNSYDAHQIDLLLEILREKNIGKPLYWIYNPFFSQFIEHSPGQIHVVHATEDYLGKHEEISLGSAEVVRQLKHILNQTDLVVAVTDGVAEGIRKEGEYRHALVVARNGCDVTQWRRTEPAIPMARTAIFQGGINQRLDYDLLLELAERLPDWRFLFCGTDEAAPQPQWSRLRKRPNVEWLGALDPDVLADVQSKATAGIIPFRQVSLIRASLPLKAYEYVASGLPVVSVPIDELASEPNLFRFATDAQEFAAALQDAETKRQNTDWVARAARAADSASYDTRFNTVMERLAAVVTARSKARHKRNVLVLYDNGSTHVATIREHLEALDRYSSHHIYYLAAAGVTPADAADADMSVFDVVILHYSVRLSIPNHLMEPIARSLERFAGLKIAFLQDEYETVDVARAWLKRLKFDVLFSCVPMQHIDQVYPRREFPWMRIVPTLTGYIPDDAEIEIHQRPMRERRLTIAYRGRRLAHFYGDLGQEKLWIGLDVRRQAEARGIAVDIEVDEKHRIYGRAWYEFLANSRATLGTESGSNVFDFDGSLKLASVEHGDLPYDVFRERFLEGRQDQIRMNQISPKIFEAIRLRVALVLFEGEYSGVVKPDIHYIPLKKDLSNIDEVFAKLEDLEYLERLTDRAYRDVLEDGRYSYRSFTEGVDQQIALGTGLRWTRAKLFTVPVFVSRAGGVSPFPASSCMQPAGFPLPDGLSRADFMALLRPVYEEKGAPIDLPLKPGTPSSEPMSRLSRLREYLSRRPRTRSLMKSAGWVWDRTPDVVKGAVRMILH